LEPQLYATNLHHLTSHSTPFCPTEYRPFLATDYECNVTSRYVTYSLRWIFTSTS